MLGWSLFVDQASNVAGVALAYNGDLRAVETLNAHCSSSPISDRLRILVSELGMFLSKNLPEGDVVRHVVFEGVRSRIVLITCGAFLTCPRITAKISPTANFIESRSWKHLAKRLGATGPIKDVKGIRSLKEIAPDLFNRYKIDSDDAADAILMYLTWLEKQSD